jgi:hypothetical protein
MMEDFHDLARRAGEALDAAASVEEEARATGRGQPCQARRVHRHRPDGGPSRRARRLQMQRLEGGCLVGLRCSLSDTAPRADGRRMRSPSMRPPRAPDPPHEGCTEGSASGEEEEAPGPATTDETRSYLDLYLDTCRVHYFVCSNYFMYFHIQLHVIYSIEK